MAAALIRDNYLAYNGIKYFRANSEEVELGAYGEKRVRMFGANYLEVYKNIAFAKLDVDEAVIVDIDFNSTRSSDIEISGNFKVLGANGSVGVGNVYNKLQSSELRLVKFSVQRGDMVDAINASPRVRDKIDDLGFDARIAHQVFVVMEATLAETMHNATNFQVGATSGDVTIEAKGKVARGRESKVVLSEGSTFAYLLLRMEWDHRSRRRRTEVVNASDDQWSVG